MTEQIKQLVKMSEQIALNLAAGHDDAAVANKTMMHLRRFWTPAMRQQLIEFWRADGTVTPVVAMALAELEKTDQNRSEAV